MAYDLGDAATPAIEIRDTTGGLANGGAVHATITLPDGVTSKVDPGDFTITNPSVGLYRATYTTTAVGRHVIRWVVTGANAGVHVDVFDVDDAARAPLVSLPEVRRYLRLFTPDPARDDELRSVLEASTTLCEDYADRLFRRQTVVEVRSGRGRCGLVLYRGPATSITSVTENGVLLTAADYTLDSNAGVLYRGSGEWSNGQQDITVTYIAGLQTVSPRVVEAVLVTVAHLWEPRRGGASGRSGDVDYSSAAPWALPRRAEQLLDRDRPASFA